MDSLFPVSIVSIQTITAVAGVSPLLVPLPGSSVYPENFLAEIFLLLAIFCTISVSLLFFLMTLYKKILRIREIKNKQEYQEIIDDLLFNLLFNEKDVREVIQLTAFRKHKDIRLFQQLTIKTLVGLHHNYSGIYSTKLEEFFAESELAAYSLAKLNSQNWADIVEGIRDLSSLNYRPAYPRIVSYKNHNNRFVKTEVLLGMIKLKGISELLKFKKSKVYFNDWVQSNVLFVVRNHKIPAPENLCELLESRNKSILLLTVRLIKYYGSSKHYGSLAGFYEKTDDPVLKEEIALLLDKTE